MEHLPVICLLCSYLLRNCFLWCTITFIDCLKVNLNFDILAHKNATCLEPHIPVEAPVLTVNLCFCAQPCNLQTVGVFTLTVVLCFESNGFCDTMHRQIANYIVLVAAKRLNPGTFKCESWIVLNVKEIWRTKMVIAVRIAGIDASSINLCVNPGVFRVLFVNMKVTAEYVKASPNCGKHHMFDCESRFRMCWIYFP